MSLVTLNKSLQTSPETIFRFKRLIGLKITSVKFTHPKGKTGRFLLCHIILYWFELLARLRAYYRKFEVRYPCCFI